MYKEIINSYGAIVCLNCGCGINPDRGYCPKCSWVVGTECDGNYGRVTTRRGSNMDISEDHDVYC